jgi:hypothetical protein
MGAQAENRTLMAGVDRIDGVWRAGWPNPADLNFDFFTLLKEDPDSPIAVVSKQAAAKRIAVIERTFDWDLYTYCPGWDSDLPEPEPHGFQ